MLNMSTLADRLRLALEKAEKIPAELARACDVTEGAVSQWLSGGTKKLKSATAIRAANFLNVNILWLTEERGQMFAPISMSAEITEGEDEAFASIKRVKFTLSAGISGFEIEILNGHRAPIFFRKDWLKQRGFNAESLFAV